jgi:acyl-CoA thioesterase-1
MDLADRSGSFPPFGVGLPAALVLVDMIARSLHFGIIAAIGVVLTWVSNAEAAAEARATRIVVLGDSLTAGYGVSAADAFPAKLERALKAKGHPVVVVNAGVSGDTAEMGLARLDRSIDRRTDAVILELGANDMLQGREPDTTRTSLEAILRGVEVRRLAVLLCGVRTQPNRGGSYRSNFAEMFSSLAREHHVLFYPAFDDAFVDNPGLKQSDGLHPTATGIEAVVVRMLPLVEELIDRARRMGRPNP